MSNAPIIREIVRPVKNVITGDPPAQQTATVRKQAQTSDKVFAGASRGAIAAANEKAVAAVLRSRQGGYRSLMARDVSGEDRLSRTLGGSGN